jgi:hypothetical protein
MKMKKTFRQKRYKPRISDLDEYKRWKVAPTEGEPAGGAQAPGFGKKQGYASSVAEIRSYLIAMALRYATTFRLCSSSVLAKR